MNNNNDQLEQDTQVFAQVPQNYCSKNNEK